jgi:hypothetical protein
MATKTISLDLEAYECLRRARRVPDESFSQVIKRGQWPRGRRTCAGFAAAMARLPPLDPDTLARLDQAQSQDAAPEDAWRTR